MKILLQLSNKCLIISIILGWVGHLFCPFYIWLEEIKEENREKERKKNVFGSWGGVGGSFGVK